MVLKRRKAPYAGTPVPPERSKMEIDRLLREYGADGVQWTEHWAQNHVEVRFILQSDEKRRPIIVRLVPPAFLAKHKTWNQKLGRSELVEAPNWSQSFRLLKAYLKTKLEAVIFGLRDVEEEFLSDMMVVDRQGRETTVGELVRAGIAAGEVRPMLPAGSEDKDGERQGPTVEASFRSVP